MNRGVQETPVFPAKSMAESDGPATSQTAGADGTGNLALGRERRPLYRLHKSDVLDVSIAFAPEFNQAATIQPDGFISLKEVGRIFAEGSSASELEQSIAAAYARLLRDPQVSVVLKDFDRPHFIVGGEVARPGKYELRGAITLSEAVAVAGGFTQQSRHSQVVLFRRVSASLVETHVFNVKEMLKHKNLTEEPALEPGDYVFVPRNMVSKIMRFMPSTSMGMYSSSSRF